MYSIIAGNHDLPLHKSWYETNYSRFHDGRKEVRVNLIAYLLSITVDDHTDRTRTLFVDSLQDLEQQPQGSFIWKMKNSSSELENMGVSGVYTGLQYVVLLSSVALALMLT